MNTLPQEGFVRLPQIVGDPKAIPPIPPLIPVSKSTWWAGVKSGRFPRSYKLGPGTTVWKAAEVRDYLVSVEQSASEGVEHG